MQAIYGTDTRKGRGIIAATNDITSDISDTLSRWNTNITSETRSYFLPTPGTARTNDPERIYNLVTEQNVVYLMCTVYDNDRDRQHRWNTETHGVFLNAKVLENPGSFLYLDENQFDPLNAVLAENFDTSSRKNVSDMEAMQLCGFLNADGTISEKYRSLMRCIYSILRENTAAAQTLFVKVDSGEKALLCLQSVYAGIPDSLQDLISSSNVPMTAVSLPFILPKYAGQVPSGAKIFDLETGVNNVPSDELNLYFFEKYLEAPQKIRSMLNSVEKELCEDWSSRTEEHYEFLSCYLLGMEKISDPSLCSDQEIERIIGSLLSVSSSSDNVNEILGAYVKSCFDRQYVIKTPRLYGTLHAKRMELLNGNDVKKCALGNFIREYEAWLLMTTDSEQEIALLSRMYKRDMNSQQQLNDELCFVIKYMPDVKDKAAFADNLVSKNLIRAFGNMDNFPMIADYCSLCSSISNSCGISIMQMVKTIKKISDACIRSFERKYYDDPERLCDYFERIYCRDLEQLEIPENLCNYIIREIRTGFWKGFRPENYRLWLKSPTTLNSLRCMVIPENQEMNSVFLQLSNTYKDVKALPCDDRYAKNVMNLLQRYKPNLQRLLAEVLVYESFEPNSSVQQICMHHDRKWNEKFCIHLYSVLDQYYPIPGNIFDVVKENEFKMFEDLAQIDLEGASDELFEFFINQLSKKIEVCRDDERKMYETIRSKAVSSRNKNAKQNEKMANARQHAEERSERLISDDSNKSNRNNDGFFKQGKKLFGNLFKGRK